MDIGDRVIQSLEEQIASLQLENSKLRETLGGDAATPKPADLTLYVDPNGGVAAAADEFKMDFEGKREMVDPARANTLITTAQKGGANVSFKKVSLANKSYSQDAAKVVADTLQTFKSVKIADLADIIAGRVEAEALIVLKTICDGLGHLDLESVDLSDNALGEKGVRACGAILFEKKNLQKLWFNNVGCSAECAAVIREIVLSNDPTSLRLFHFFNNMSGPGGAAELAQIVENSPLLEDLRFSGTRCQSEGSLAFAQGIAALSEKQFAANGGAGCLVNLDLADNVFKEEGSELLAKALKSQPNLTVLNLRDAGLGDEGVTEICNAIGAEGNAPKLVKLELSGNEISDDNSVMEAVGACVVTKTTLQHLGLEENEMASAGGNALAAAFAGLSAGGIKGSLTHLSLGTNEMGSGAGLALAKSLAGFSSLTEIGLNTNSFSEDGLEKLKEQFESNGQTSKLVARFERRIGVTGLVADFNEPFDENDDEGDPDA
jgi:Ran GTPase-activating protein (RanGAP) involved in mRNA processing and transport